MNHLALMQDIFYDYVKAGQKSKECRATKNKTIPWQKVHEHDIIYFTRIGSGIVDLQATVFRARYHKANGYMNVYFYLSQYKDDLCIDEDWIRTKAEARYISVFWLSDVKSIDPFPFYKRDRRPWIFDFHLVPESITHHIGLDRGLNGGGP